MYGGSLGVGRSSAGCENGCNSTGSRSDCAGSCELKKVAASNTSHGASPCGAAFSRQLLFYLYASLKTRTSVLTDKSFTFSPILMEGGENGEGSGRCDRTR